VREAELLQANGVDAIVAQGSEAGGHRGTFLDDWRDALTGTLALVPQITDRIEIPVIAAGGIMDGRGIIAALALGAEGVQMGTAFLPCKESGAHECHKKAVLSCTEDRTVLTRAFSGRPARGIRNRFTVEMETHRDILPAYPLQNALTRDIRQAAAKQNRPEFLSLWAGQAAALSRGKTAGELLAEWIQEAEQILQQLHN
jgi:nitronate monooxygenase